MDAGKELRGESGKSASQDVMQPQECKNAARTEAETNLSPSVDGSSTARDPLEFEISESFLLYIALLRDRRMNGGDVGPRRKLKEFKAVNKGLRTPSRVPVRALHIGSKKVKMVRADELDIVVKFCYQTKKVACQLSSGHSSWRIDILCGEIRNIYACFDDARFETLSVEVKGSPKFYYAAKPPPKNFRRWKDCHDFTGGVASEARYFHLEIEKGTLEKCYGKLLYSDAGLPNLPSPLPQEAQCFEHRIDGGRVRLPTQVVNTLTPLAPSRAAVFHSSSAQMPGKMNTSYSGTGFTTGYEDTQVYGMQSMIQHTNLGNLRFVGAPELAKLVGGICGAITDSSLAEAASSRRRAWIT